MTERYKEIFISFLPPSPAPAIGLPRNGLPARAVLHFTSGTVMTAACVRIHRERHWPCRIRPQGNLARRNRNARPDGDARGIRPEAAAERRAHRRLAAHDDPDRGADRDAHRARRRRALGLVQHLFDAGSRGGRDRGGGRAGVRREGRDAEGLLGLHRQAVRLARRRLPEHDPRRRRRRHHVRPSRRCAPRRATRRSSTSRAPRKRKSSSRCSRSS